MGKEVADSLKPSATSNSRTPFPPRRRAGDRRPPFASASQRLRIRTFPLNVLSETSPPPLPAVKRSSRPGP
jgi:hypothetical protein